MRRSGVLSFPLVQAVPRIGSPRLTPLRRVCYTNMKPILSPKPISQIRIRAVLWAWEGGMRLGLAQLEAILLGSTTRPAMHVGDTSSIHKASAEAVCWPLPADWCLVATEPAISRPWTQQRVRRSGERAPATLPTHLKPT